jgi:hypothetical protein
MDVLLPGLSSEEILTRGACRAALKARIAADEQADRQRQLHTFQRVFAARPDASRVLTDAGWTSLGVDASQHLANFIGSDFQYVPSAEHLARVAEFNSACDQLIPANLNTTRWSKNGCCECVMHYVYELDGLGRRQTFHVKRCSAHAALGDIAAVHDAIDDEVRRRGAVYRLALGLDPSHPLNLGITTANAGGGVVEKPDVEIRLSFSGTGTNRPLSVELVGAGVPPSAKIQLRAACNTRFGNGVVTVL